MVTLDLQAYVAIDWASPHGDPGARTFILSVGHYPIGRINPIISDGTERKLILLALFERRLFHPLNEA